MRYAITGATGLLGGNLAIELCRRGHEVVAIRRGRTGGEHLREPAIRWVPGELGDQAALRAAFEGCDAVFHCAAAVSIRRAVQPWIVAANVDGTRNVVDAVRAAGVRRMVHCSTVGAVGLSVDGQPCDETARWNMADFGLDDAYVTTKRRAQDLVLDAVARDGLDAVVVNPTYMIGPYDAKPSSGKLVRDLVRGTVPGYTLGRNNFVDVRDVARGMVAALERGRAGELYILGGENMTYHAFMDLVSDATGAPRVRRRVPLLLARALGLAGDAYLALTDRESLLTTAVVLWSMTDRFVFTSDKAVRELGYQISPLPDAVRAAVAWFRENGML